MKPSLSSNKNHLRNYVALTGSLGCMASVTEGAIQVLDLSSISPVSRSITFPNSDAIEDFQDSAGLLGYFITGRTSFYSDVPGLMGLDRYASPYQSGPADFPSDPDGLTGWAFFGAVGGGFEIGTNWVAFRDSEDRFGWLSFDLRALVPITDRPITSYNYFVFDPDSTSPADAISLDQAIAAVPEPSGLALLALGATGLSARRARKKTLSR